MDDQEARKILLRGPQPVDPQGRRAAVERIVSRLEATYGRSVVALGLYGSTARDADREFSDIELFCVVSAPGATQQRWEWTDGAGKYEVEVFSEDVVKRKAAELDEAWPVTHAKFANLKALRGKPAVFAELNRLVFDHAEDQFRDVIRNIVVAELFEGLGKVRNFKSNSNYAVLPRVAMRIATMAELMIGLAHKHIYTASGLATVESMALSPRPAGHDELCTMVMRGELDHPNRTSQVIENYWKGVVEWAADSNIDLARACRWPI